MLGVLGLGGGAAVAQEAPDGGKLSKAGVARASALVDSVFVDRTRRDGLINPGDWASYLLARLGVNQIPDSLGIRVEVDTTHIEVRGRLQDLPPEARGLLGPVASMVDSSTMIVADVTLQRTGPEVARFWLRGIKVNGMSFPDFLLGGMMAQVGRQYPALTSSGRDLYVQVPADGVLALTPGAIRIAVVPRPAGARSGTSSPP